MRPQIEVGVKRDGKSFKVHLHYPNRHRKVLSVKRISMYEVALCFLLFMFYCLF